MKHPKVEQIHRNLKIHTRLYGLYRKYNGKKDPECLWEIGALDGQDSISMKQIFEATHFIAFEPSPESFVKVRENLISIGVKLIN